MTDNAWERVWVDRDREKADWNGYEACFESDESYRSFVDQATETVASILKVGTDDNVLDLGCGTGRLSLAMSNYAATVTGLDFSPAALAVARRTRSSDRVRYRQGDLNTMDLDDLRGFNKAFAFGAFLYLKDVSRVERILRALVGAGTDVLALDMPDARIPDGRARDYDRDAYPHLAFTVEQIRSWFPRAAFYRDLFPDYANNEHRFAVHVRAE